MSKIKIGRLGVFGAEHSKCNRMMTLGFKGSLTPTFCWRAILISEVGHTDLVLGLRSGFIGRSVQARLQVSVCSSYDCATLVNIQTHSRTHTHAHRLILISLYEKLSQQS